MKKLRRFFSLFLAVAVSVSSAVYAFAVDYVKYNPISAFPLFSEVFEAVPGSEGAYRFVPTVDVSSLTGEQLAIWRECLSGAMASSRQYDFFLVLSCGNSGSTPVTCSAKFCFVKTGTYGFTCDSGGYPMISPSLFPIHVFKCTFSYSESVSDSPLELVSSITTPTNFPLIGQYNGSAGFIPLRQGAPLEDLVNPSQITGLKYGLYPYSGVSTLAITDNDTENPPPTYPLTINYLYEDGTIAVPSYTVQLEAGAEYTVNSPTLEGYTPDKAVISGTMTEEGASVTVTYAKNPPPTYPLTVNYLFSDGSRAAPPFVQEYEAGTVYSVPSPSVEGYTPDKAAVSGAMTEGGVSITVTYSPKEPPPPGPDKPDNPFWAGVDFGNPFSNESIKNFIEKLFAGIDFADPFASVDYEAFIDRLTGGHQFSNPFAVPEVG